MEKKPRKVTEKDLPLTVQNVEVVQQMKSQKLLGGFVVIIGLIPLLYGAYLMMFGPDHVMVNRFTGPTFYQTILLNPGLVVSLGFVIVYGGTHIRGAAANKVVAYVDEHFTLHNDYGKPATDATIVAQPTVEGDLVLHFTPLKSPDESLDTDNTTG